MNYSDIIGLKELPLATLRIGTQDLFGTPGITHIQNQASRGFLQQDLRQLASCQRVKMNHGGLKRCTITVRNQKHASN
jgi:hypothetical protein